MAVGLLLASTSSVLSGCNLSDEECLKVRTEAFDVINESHVCGDDADCEPTRWPGCGKPVNTKNLARVDPMQDKFDKSGCKDDAQECRPTPEVYCKQGLCVFRELRAIPDSK
jgi:hypothetical protein